MNKVPVQKTIVAAYSFLFAHIGKIAWRSPACRR